MRHGQDGILGEGHGAYKGRGLRCEGTFSVEDEPPSPFDFSPLTEDHTETLKSRCVERRGKGGGGREEVRGEKEMGEEERREKGQDRKSTRLNSSH